MPTSSRIPSLDGLRAVAVSFVLLAHVTHARGISPSLQGRFWFELGRLGVTVFFVLSGFMITVLLVDELRRSGTVSLRNFFIRRALRILPPAYAFVAVVAILGALGIVPLAQGDLLHAITFTVNFHPDRAWAIGNLWSLGVEEQFYLIWPPVFLWLGLRRSVWLAGGAIALVPVLRVAFWVMFPRQRNAFEEQFELICDGLASGCLLALLVTRHGVQGVNRRIPAVCVALAPLVIAGSMAFEIWPAFMLPCGITLINLSVAVLVLWCVANADSMVGRALNSRVAVFGGAISYSLYLWQQVFTDRSMVPDSVPFPANVACSIAAAVASYYLLERPIVSLRRRFRTPATTARQHPAP
jgi:peptidoglycan/LPS O-acetylase OafA/YrhL